MGMKLTNNKISYKDLITYIDGVAYMKCLKCGETKQLTEENFYKKNNGQDWIITCKCCKKMYYQDNRAKKIAYQREYTKLNREYYREYSSNYNKHKKRVTIEQVERNINLSTKIYDIAEYLSVANIADINRISLLSMLKDINILKADNSPQDGYEKYFKVVKVDKGKFTCNKLYLKELGVSFINGLLSEYIVLDNKEILNKLNQLNDNKEKV